MDGSFNSTLNGIYTTLSHSSNIIPKCRDPVSGSGVIKAYALFPLAKESPNLSFKKTLNSGVSSTVLYCIVCYPLNMEMHDITGDLVVDRRRLSVLVSEAVQIPKHACYLIVSKVRTAQIKSVPIHMRRPSWSLLRGSCGIECIILFFGAEDTGDGNLFLEFEPAERIDLNRDCVEVLVLTEELVEFIC